MNKIALIVFIVIVGLIYLKDDSVKLGPGVRVHKAPQQIKISDPIIFKHNGYFIKPMATFHIKAKVLSRKNYSLGRETDLSPIDLALGWKNMSDEAILESIDISQSSRWYRWYVKSFPISRKEIETQSANMHIIPANTLVESKLERIRQGEIVELSGSLVRVDASDGWRWISSLSRKDTGAHACELFWVEDIKIQN